MGSSVVNAVEADVLCVCGFFVIDVWVVSVGVVFEGEISVVIGSSYVLVVLVANVARVVSLGKDFVVDSVLTVV